MKGQILKILIFLGSIAAIVALFFLVNQTAEEDTAEAEAEAVSLDESYDLSFQFDPEELKYDGTGDLDFLEGVSLEGYNFQELKDMVFIRVYTVGTRSEKEVEYTADTKDGRARSKRPLLLENYSGPEIILPEEMPEVRFDQVDKLAAILKEDEGYRVDDGFGNDERDHVEITYEKDPRDTSLIHYKIALNNGFGDRAVAEEDVVVAKAPVRLVLTDLEISLHSGEEFDPYEYIELAQTDSGRSVEKEVLINGGVDVDIPGTYNVTYEYGDVSAELIVHVD